MTMSADLWFIIPAHGRPEVSAFCFPAVAWACRELGAHAVVVAEDENLGIASAAGLHALRKPNSPLGRKWNDGYEYACRQGAAYCCSLGSDDWVHPEAVDLLVQATAKAPLAVGCTHSSSCVSPDGSELCELHVPYEGGDGVRVLPRALLERVAYRPTMDMREKAIDGGMRDRLVALGAGHSFVAASTDPLHIVDFKSAVNLTSYERLQAAYGVRTLGQVAQVLGEHFPAKLVRGVRRYYDEIAG